MAGVGEKVGITNESPVTFPSSIILFLCSVAWPPFSGSRFATILRSRFATNLIYRTATRIPCNCRKSLTRKRLAEVHRFTVGFGMFVAYVIFRIIGTRLGNG